VRRCEFLSDEPDFWLKQSADDWFDISFWSNAVFLWIPLKVDSDPEFFREVEDSDLADLAVILFRLGFTLSFFEKCFLPIEPPLEDESSFLVYFLDCFCERGLRSSN